MADQSLSLKIGPFIDGTAQGTLPVILLAVVVIVVAAMIILRRHRA